MNIVFSQVIKTKVSFNIDSNLLFKYISQAI